MDESEEKELVAELEYALSVKLRPTFLIITNPNQHPEGDIYIMISTIAFKNMSVEKRVKTVFSLISKHVPDILEDRLVVIQAYSSDELEDVIEDIFSGE